MGFIITDLADKTKTLPVNFWNWHPTVELVRSIGAVDAERIEFMHQQCVGATVTEAEVRQFLILTYQSLDSMPFLILRSSNS